MTDDSIGDAAGAPSGPWPDESVTTIIVDGNNVVGSVPDGWWRDRPAAVRRLLSRLVCYQRWTGHGVVLVLDVAQQDLREGRHDGVEIRYATRSGRNAADDRILELLDDLDGATVAVVSSDRALARDAANRGAVVRGAGAFLSRLDDLGC